MSGMENTLKNQTGPMLSVVVPVYKVEEQYLMECLDSIEAQTFRDFELIIVDDGAPKETADLLDTYAQEREYITVIHKENNGVASARNDGLKKCRGKYVTFIDSDDTIRNDNFEKVIERAERDGLDILFWGLYRCFGKKQVPFTPYLADIDLFDKERLDEVQYKCMVGILPFYKKPASADAAGSACAKLYRLDFLRKNKLYYIEGLKRAEDMLFNLMAFGKAEKVGYLYDFFYYYRQLESSATYQYRENGIDVFTDTLREMGKYLASEGKSEDYLQVYYMRCMFFLLESMDMDYSNPNNPKKYGVRKRELATVAGSEPYSEAARKLELSRLTIARKIPLILIRWKMFGLLMLFYKVYGLTRRGK